MTSYTHTASGPRFGHLRTYLVGVGATAALTAGALVAFLSLATFVAFNGLPFGGSSDDAGAAYLNPNTSAAPTAAAAALGAGPGAVAKNAAPGSHGASPAAKSATAAAAGAGGTGSGGGDSSGGTGSGKAATEPGVSTSPGDITPPIAVPSLPSTSGPVTGAVQGVDNAAGTNLSGPTGGATGTVDGATNQAGTAAGQASGAVSGVTDRLGGGGPAGTLLGG